MRNGRLAMAYHTPATDDILTSDNLASEEDDIWQRIRVQGDNFGPGPPPPEFLLPPPPLPDFMLKEIDGGRCSNPNLPDSLASCDITFSSFKPSGQVPGLFGGSGDDDANGSHIQFISIALGAIALFFLALCVGIFIAWRRCRSRNRLSYLRKTSSNFETTAETSEHPLIYDDANINFSNNGANLMRAHGRLAVAHVNSYQLETSTVRNNPFHHERIIQSNSYHFDASTGTRSICRPDHFNANDTNDNESRIYEELYLAEDHVYSDAHQGALPHLSDHYQQPAVTRAANSVSRSSTLNSIKRIFGFNTQEEPRFMHYVPAPPQFMSPGALSSDSLMMMSPDYSAVYHPLTLSHPEPHTNNLKTRVGDIFHLENSPNSNLAHDALTNQLRGTNKCSNNMAESSFSSSSCSSGSTRPPSHNNSTTSTLPVACLSSSSCSCSSSTCQYQRTLSANANQKHPDEQQNVLNYLDQPVRRHLKADPLVVHHPHMVSGTMWLPQPHRRPPEASNKNETFGIFSSLWRKRKSKTSGRPDRGKKFPNSSTTIFRLEPTHPSYPRMVSNPYKIPTPSRSIADNNGNPQQPFVNAALPPLPLTIGVQHVSSLNQPQRISFGQHNFSGTNHGLPMRQMDSSSHPRPYSTGVGNFGTPTMHRVGIREGMSRPDTSGQNIHGTISNRHRRPKKKDLNERFDDNQEEEDPSIRLPLLPGDEVWRPMPVVTTLGKQTSRVASNSGVMPNPDDILPKKAWTDFSGTNEWPDFVETGKEVLDNNMGASHGKEIYENCNSQKVAPVPKERRSKPKSPSRTEAEVQFIRVADIETPDLNGLDEVLVDDDEVGDSANCTAQENIYNNNNGDPSDSDNSYDCDGDDTDARVPSRTYRATKLITLNKDGVTSLVEPQNS